MDDFPSQGVGQRNVGANVETTPQVGPLGCFAAPRIDGEQGSTVVDRFQYVLKEDRMSVTGIGTPHQNHIGLLDLGIA